MDQMKILDYNTLHVKKIKDQMDQIKNLDYNQNYQLRNYRRRKILKSKNLKKFPQFGEATQRNRSF